MNKEGKEKIKLLLVEDDEDFSSALRLRLTKRNFKVTIVPTAEEALDKIKEVKIDVVVADIKLPGMDGMELLAKVRKLYDELPVILITGYGSLDSAKEAVRLNATDYLLKPLENIDDLLNPIHKALHSYRLLLENKRLTNDLRSKIEKLKEKEEFNCALFEYNPVETIVVDRNGIVVKTNRVRRKSGDRIPKIGDVIYKDYAAKHDIDMYAELMDCIRSGKSKEFPAQKYDNKFLSIAMSPFPKGAIITSQDITDLEKTEEELKAAYTRLRETQEELIQAEKSDAIVQLAGGIAHEVKNPLAVIMQAAEYLEENVSSRKKNIRDTFDIIMDNTKRADAIIGGLADFVRITELNIKPQDINSVLKRSLTLIKHRVKLGNIQILKELKKDLPKVLIDNAKMEQAFINIFLNSIQAMPKGGKIFIRGYPTKLKEIGGGVGRRASDYFKLEEKAVIIEIEDTGTGISKENQRKLFNPFFTTKGPRGGAGLGLSVTKNIINMHRSLIDIKSEEGKGTRVIITFKVHGGK